MRVVTALVTVNEKRADRHVTKQVFARNCGKELALVCFESEERLRGSRAINQARLSAIRKFCVLPLPRR